MSGLGRRTHYRKHLTDAVLNDLPEPAQNERIAKIASTRGSNQFDLIVAHKDGSIDTTPQLAILPTKFRKLVWLKRNDYVICSCVDDQETTMKSSKIDKGSKNKASEGIKHMIEHILYKDQIKHLKEKGFWPTHDLFSEGTDNYKQNDGNHNEDYDGEESQSDDGIIYETEEINEEYYCNMNRISKLKVDDSSDDESDDVT